MTPRRVEAYFRNAKGDLVRRCQCGHLQVLANVPPRLDLRTLPGVVHCAQCERNTEPEPPRAA